MIVSATADSVRLEVYQIRSVMLSGVGISQSEVRRSRRILIATRLYPPNSKPGWQWFDVNVVEGGNPPSSVFLGQDQLQFGPQKPIASSLHSRRQSGIALHCRIHVNHRN